MKHSKTLKYAAARRRRRGLSTLTGASALLQGFNEGFAIDFRNMSMLVKDLSTPANNFSGSPLSKLTNATPPTVWTRDAAGTWNSGTTPRTDYNAAGVALGWPIHESRTNVFLNSRAPVTQNISVTAQAYTLSFYGTGTITLSGASTAGPLVGVSAGKQVSLTFTPTAGTLTLTVSGTMDFVQLEAGTYASSPIVTAGASVARAASRLSLPLSTFPMHPTKGTFVVGYSRANDVPHSTGNMGILWFGTLNAPTVGFRKLGASYHYVITSESYPDVVATGTYSKLSETCGITYDLSAGVYKVFNNGLQAGSQSGVFAALSAYAGLSLEIGASNNGIYGVCGHIQWMVYVPDTLTAAQIARIDTPLAVAGYDVFGCFGQSNNIGVAGGNIDVDTSHPDIHQWTQDGYIAKAQDGLNYASSGLSADAISYHMTFARAYIAAGKLAPGRKILLVPYATAGTSIEHYWGVGLSLYNNLVSKCNAAMAANPGNVFKGFLMHQGESDCSAGGAPNYATRLDAMIAGLRGAITGASNAPFVCGNLADSFVTNTGANAVTVQAALSAVGGRVTKAACASASGLATVDGTHFTAASQRSLGANYFTAYDTID